jgi:uncharacterized protein (DUF1919 family)
MRKIKLIYSIFIEKLYRIYIQSKIKNQDFTIISNDCWGGRLYMDLGLEYNSPTVNLFIYSSCFIKFINNLREYLTAELTFKSESFYDIANKNRKKDNLSYPIGCLKDIEIHFLHSKNEFDAQKKWEKRIKRVNYENLYYKFSDAYLIDEDDLVKFDNFPSPKKVSFTSKNHPEIKCNVWIKDFKDKEYVLDPFAFRWKYRKYFDVVKWLNNM